MKQPVSFTPARFNTGVNEEEKTIVTSTGPYVITWNFRRVKNGHYDYQIKQYADNVVADNFKFGQDRSIIVALPHDGKFTAYLGFAGLFYFLFSSPNHSFFFVDATSHGTTQEKLDQPCRSFCPGKDLSFLLCPFPSCPFSLFAYRILLL